MTKKFVNPTKVITGPKTRWSYCNVWQAKSISGGTPKFSVSLIIPKSDTVTINKIKAAIQAAYTEGESKLKGNGKTVPPLSVLKTPLRDGDTERPDDPAYADVTSSMQTLQQHRESLMLIVRQSLITVKFTAVFMVVPALIFMLLILMETVVLPAV